MPASPLIVARDKERTRQMMADLLAGAKRAPSDIAGMPSVRLVLDGKGPDITV